MQPIKNYLKRPNRILLGLLKRVGVYLLSDKWYLMCRYRLEMGEPLNLRNPKTFTEKIQWLKLYNRKPEYTTMVDKYAVKQYVADRIGEEYIIPTLGVWNRPEEIDFESLPNQFVLKTTHGGGGGGVVICKDKATFDKDKAIKKLRASLKEDIYRNFKEWPYKNVPKRIIAEKFMTSGKNPIPADLHSETLRDYKFYCFDGEPRIMMISTGRFGDNLYFDYYDMEWNKLPLVWDRPNSNVNHSKPKCFDEMKQIARKLSKDMPHIRVDLYCINEHPYFGELTFFDASGFCHFEDEAWNEKLGLWIKEPFN